MSAGRARVAVVVAALGASLVACQLLVGAGDEEGTPAPSASGASAAPPDLCQHALPPPASSADDGPDGPPVWFATTLLDGLPRVDAKPFGLDQDGLCTGFLGATEQDGGAPCQRAVVDDRGGIDNAASRLFMALPDGAGTQLFRGVARAARQGERTLLVGLSKYNGGPDDPSVEVRLVTSGPLETTLCDGGIEPDAAPRVEGCDTWSRAATDGGNVDGGALPEAVLEGYVVGGTLVAGTRRPMTLALDVLEVTLSLQHARVVATLDEKAAGGRRVRTLTGVVAGRLAPQALLEELGRDPALCASMRGVRAAVCDYRDIPSGPEDDRGPGKACANISIGLQLAAVEALVGAEVVPRPQRSRCDAETTCD